jgi:hypothetical protein
VTAEVTQLAMLPTALSITWANLVLPTTFSEPIALEIAQNTGKYIGAQLFTGFMYIAAAICVWLLKAWKIGDNERKDTSVEASRAKSSLTKRLFMIKKV